MKHTYTKTELEKAVRNNISISGTLKELGVIPAGGNYRTVKKIIEKYQIDCSHFKGQGYLKGKTHNYSKRPLSELLVKGKLDYYSSHQLKLRILNEGVKKRKCERCGNHEWLGEPIPVELHHIDGDCNNNTIENLQILCPNCHTFTPNYRGRKKKKVFQKEASQKAPKKVEIEKTEQLLFVFETPRTRAKHKLSIRKNCLDCDKTLHDLRSTRCKECSVKNQIGKCKIDWPPLEKLIDMVKKGGYTKVSRELGISDNAIRKRIKKYSGK